MVREITLIPQKGAQEKFLSTKADIAIYGGAAGGGKTWALLYEATRYIKIKGFGGVIFRRLSEQIKNEGGLWDESKLVYPYHGGEPKESVKAWVFPGGNKISFSSIQYEKDVQHFDGAQIPFIGFDELIHFTRRQFIYLLSRNRTTCGVKPYIRATTNPDADSWVREFIDWWIDSKTGLPIKERSGKIRFFVNVQDVFRWANTPQELSDQYDCRIEDCKSVTFIAANVFDNKILMKKDPSYLANLNAQSKVDRARLLEGNWNIKAEAGLFFQKTWFEFVDAAPVTKRKVRYWDLAATEKTVENNPDWTVGVLMSVDDDGIFYIEDVVRKQQSPLKIEKALITTASQDGEKVEIGVSQDPGQAGKAQAAMMIRKLAGFNVKAFIETGDKVTRAKSFSAQCEAGNVKIVRGSWNDDFLNVLENFPDGDKDDDVDSSSNAFNMLTGKKKRLRPSFRQL